MDQAALQARALGSPTRHRLYELVAADGPIGVAELAAALGIHPSAVRIHLGQLEAANLVEDAPEPAGPKPRGRPARRFQAVDRTAPQDEIHYERLAKLLLEALASGDGVRAVGRAAGRDLATGPAVEAGLEPVPALVRLVTRSGFAPAVRSRGSSLELTLANCPFADVAAANPEIVCDLHLGLLEGAAEAIGGITVDQLRPRDPHRAGCLVQARVAPEG